MQIYRKYLFSVCQIFKGCSWTCGHRLKNIKCLALSQIWSFITGLGKHAQQELISASFEGNRLNQSLNHCKEGGLHFNSGRYCDTCCAEGVEITAECCPSRFNLQVSHCGHASTGLNLVLTSVWNECNFLVLDFVVSEEWNVNCHYVDTAILLVWSALFMCSHLTIIN